MNNKYKDQFTQELKQMVNITRVCWVIALVMVMLKLFGVLKLSWLWTTIFFWIPLLELSLFIILFTFLFGKLDDSV